MKAIQIKFLGATDYKPSRIKATAEGVKSITGCLPNGDYVFCFKNQ